MISVIMSIYSEPEEWIELSINSILNQTYNNFEFLIINDNPQRKINDTILKKFKKIDSRIIIIKNRSNIGLTRSLNKGLMLAKGKYIARMDSDDISNTNRFYKQYNFLEANKEYVACGSNYIEINNIGMKRKIIKQPESDIDINSDLVVYNPLAHPSLMIKNENLKSNKIKYDESLKYSQDYKFIYNLSQKGKLYNVQEPLLKYRVSNNQITKTKSKDQLFLQIKLDQ